MLVPVVPGVPGQRRRGALLQVVEELAGHLAREKRYSLVDEAQAYVGPRNQGQRFPGLLTTDIAFTRVASFAGRRVRVGVRVYHVFNDFAPRTVQNNVDAALFGAFTNGLPRRFGVSFSFEPH